jgi:hypothetical protein
MDERVKCIDRRRAPRLWRRARAEILVVRGLRSTKTVPCELLNRSRTGALISLPHTSDIPDDFYLVVVGEAERLTCAVARRGPKLLGVRFVPRTTSDVRVIRLSAM